MKETIVKSKVYITPKRKSFIPIIFLNICIIITAILSLLSIIYNGVKVKSISGIVIALFIVTRIKGWSKIESYYQFSIANVNFSEDCILIKYDMGRVVSIKISSIKSLEYSDQLQCVRFLCKYTCFENNETTKYELTEFLFYVDEKENKEFFDYIKEYVELDICYIDRA